MANKNLVSNQILSYSTLAALDQLPVLEEQLSRAETNKDKHDARVALVIASAKISADFWAKAYQHLLAIQELGEWKKIQVVDADTGEIQSWQRFDEFASDLLAPVKSMQRSTIQVRLRLARTFITGMGMSDAESVALIEDKPTIADGALAMFERDDMTGVPIGFISDDERQRAREMLGYGDDDDPTDDELIHDVFKRIADLPQSDAAGLVESIRVTKKCWWNFDKGKRELVWHHVTITGHERDEKTVRIPVPRGTPHEFIEWFETRKE